MKNFLKLFMKLTYLQSASVIVENKGVKILCDPWLVDGEYYGSWIHYPPLNFKPEDFNDLDYIYISHIHLDHFSPKTLKLMNKDIPVLILNYVNKFLKNNLERLGFKVIELEHNLRVALKGGMSINILAADYCDPEKCGLFTGCSFVEDKYGSTHIDSMSVIDDGNEVIVNTNDCPFDIAKYSVEDIKRKYKNIDLLLVGYSGAGPFPQCFELKEEEKNLAAQKKKKQFFKQAEEYINLFKPKYFMPFAGRYTLAGKLHSLNNQRGVPELEEANEYFLCSTKIDQKQSKSIILNPMESFDIKTGKASNQYKPIDITEKEKYIQQYASKIKFDYESESVSFNDIEELIPKAFEKFNRKRKEFNYTSKCTVLIPIPNNRCVVLPMDGNDFKILEVDRINETEYVKLTVDNRLLKWILLGPKYAHWNNAEVGSHIKFERKPEKFDRALYFLLSFFHS